MSDQPEPQASSPAQTDSNSSSSQPDDQQQLQHITNKPRLQRGKQQRRTTYAIPASPKKNPDSKPYNRRTAAPSSPRRQSSPASTSISPSSGNNSSNNENGASTPRSGQSTPSGDSSTKSFTPAGGKQVLPPLPQGGVKLRRSVKGNSNGGDKSSPTPNGDENGLFGTIMMVGGVLIGAAVGAAGVWYYFTQVVPQQQRQEGDQHINQLNQ